jgi:glycolate oxidase FAD binding subunit
VLDWHGGQRWYAAPASQASTIRTAARDAGGHATLFRMAGPAVGSVARFDALSPPLRRIHEALLHEFDPHAVFDRGRLLHGD